VRAGLRTWGGKAAVTRHQAAATLGIGLALAAAPVLSGVLLDGAAAVTAAVLGLCLLLLTQDLAWRWLPLEWTVPLAALALVAAFVGNTVEDALIGAGLGAGLLWTLQITFRRLRGTEAIGSGDIWLAAGIGGLAGATTIAWVLGLSALTGLAEERGKIAMFGPPDRKRWGVAYGAHMIAVFLILWPL
jgi:leader peptidase (prepilin peptidase)/N-methyltransferase